MCLFPSGKAAPLELVFQDDAFLAFLAVTEDCWQARVRAAYSVALGYDAIAVMILPPQTNHGASI